MDKTRFARVSSLLMEYHTGFYKRDPELAKSSYEKQYRTIMDDCFSFADYWKVNLEKTGKYDAVEILMNVEPLQKRWAEENDVSFAEDNWMDEILCRQISLFRPDVVFIQPNMKTSLRRRLREENPSIKLMMNWDGAFLNDPEKVAGCKLVLSDDPINAGFYSKNGLTSYHFSFGFEKRVLNNIVSGRQMYDVSFIGSLQMKNNFHAERLKFLSAIAKKTKLKTWIPYFPALHGRIDKSWAVQVKKMCPRYYFDALRVFCTNNGGVFGLKMFQVLADSKVTLNMHANQYVRAGNMRLWEATGVGTCLGSA